VWCLLVSVVKLVVLQSTFCYTLNHQTHDVVQSICTKQTLSIQYKAGLASSCWKGIAATTPKLERYITDMDNWMSANRLKLNMDKTELLWAGTRYNVNVEWLWSLSIAQQRHCQCKSTCTRARSPSFFGSESGQTRFQCQCDLLLSSSSTQTHPAVAWRWFGGDTPSRVDNCNAILAAAPKTITDRLQRVLNAAAQVVSDTKKFDQGLSQLMHQELHWLDIPERVNYKLGVLTHQCLLSKAPGYLSNCCIPVSQVATRRHLHSAARHQLTVPRHRLNTYGRRAFAVAGPSPTMFNTLPDDLRDPAVSTSTFRQSLKTHLFSAYQHV